MNYKSMVFQYIKDHSIGFIITGALGLIASVALVVIKPNPDTSKEIRARLVDLSLERLTEERAFDREPIITVQSYFTETLGLHPSQSVVLFGTAKQDGGETDIRFLAIFEPNGQSVVDKITDSPGFYRLASFSHFEVPDSESLLSKKIEANDLDQDGNKEIIVHLKSNWADSTSLGLVVLKKDENGDWNFLSLPSITNLMRRTAAGLYKPPARPPVSSGPIPVFGTMGKSSDLSNLPPFSELAEWGVSEDNWTATHDGRDVEFVTLRNGGNYYVKSHVVKGHTQILTVAFSRDENAVQGPHYAIVSAFRFSHNALVRDDLWNWGYPMTSDVALNLGDLDIDSLHKGGVLAHVVGNTFYGYTDFQKLEAPLTSN